MSFEHRPLAMPKEFLGELEDFFVNYRKLEGKKYKLLGCKNAGKASDLIEKARRAV
jgi:inorganic pyrophosphatase